jgi:L-serine dehydratase
VTVYVSALDLFSIGIGPSSSHTVGPMRAARRFASPLEQGGSLLAVTRIGCVLYGSLAATGIGHGTPDAVVAGLTGSEPETCDPARVRGAWIGADEAGCLHLLDSRHTVPFTASAIVFEPRTRLPGHPNALTLRAWAGDDLVAEQTYLSIGGGFIRLLGEEPCRSADDGVWSFSTADELLELCRIHELDVAEIALRNELAARSADASTPPTPAGEAPERAVLDGLDAIVEAMHSCVEHGLHATGELPGGLHVSRRAAAMHSRLVDTPADTPDLALQWMRAFALAVNEENASGGRVVTAPTNGAAGILPAVLEYHLRFNPRAAAGDEHRYLLTAAAVGSILKANASISGAEGGCQAEVGSACAMAAAGLCAVLGGTPSQVENAAEIAIEHHLGLTCDPVGGLVQIPCIERNAIAASTAVSAASLALHGDGRHIVSLDTVVETMRQTGSDMSEKYKETSAAGLAVNVVEC